MTVGAIFLVQTILVVFVPLAVCRAGKLANFVPLVVLQILLGIALGPSVLGRVWPTGYAALFSDTTLTPLGGIGSIAVLFFGFVTGLHVNTNTFRGRGPAFSLLAAVSVVAPTAGGFAVGLWIASPENIGARAGPIEFAAAIGIATGVTALPVLGAILRQMKLMGQRIADLALGIAAVNDVLLWFTLGVLLMFNAARSEIGFPFAVKIIGAIAYGLAAVIAARYPWARLSSLSNRDRLSDAGLVTLCAIMMISATVTEVLGLHFVLGAFVAGLIVPREIRHLAIERLEFMTVSILMPFYFMGAGFKTSISFDSPGFLQIVLLTTSVAIAGKLGGTALTARCVGEPWPTSLGLGALVQTKGLMEVIVLAILLDSKIISVNVYSALIVMALITTSMTTPLARLALSRSSGNEAQAGESLERKGRRAARRRTSATALTASAVESG